MRTIHFRNIFIIFSVNHFQLADYLFSKCRDILCRIFSLVYKSTLKSIATIYYLVILIFINQQVKKKIILDDFVCLRIFDNYFYFSPFCRFSIYFSADFHCFDLSAENHYLEFCEGIFNFSYILLDILLFFSSCYVLCYLIFLFYFLKILQLIFIDLIFQPIFSTFLDFLVFFFINVMYFVIFVLFSKNSSADFH